MVSKRAKVGIALGGVAALATVALVAGTARADERKQQPGPLPPAPEPEPETETETEDVIVTPPDKEGMPNGAPVVVKPPPVPTTPPEATPAPPVPTAPTAGPIQLKAGRWYRFKIKLDPPLEVSELPAFIAASGADAKGVQYEPATGEVLMNMRQAKDATLHRGDTLLHVGPQRVIFLGAIEIEPPKLIEEPEAMIPTTTAPEPPPLGPDEEDEDEGGFEQPTDIGDLETDPENDPNGTIGLARMLIARETAPGWRTDLQDDVKEWQEKVGLVPDGKLGLEGIARMAEEVGMLPLVRFWTLGKHWDRWSAMDGQDGYRKRIGAIVERLKKDPESRSHARALEESIERQAAAPVGSAFPPYPKADAVPSLEQVAKILERVEADADEEAAEMIRRVS